MGWFPACKCNPGATFEPIALSLNPGSSHTSNSVPTIRAALLKRQADSGEDVLSAQLQGVSLPPTAPEKPPLVCFGCRKQFGVPPNAPVVRCPFCQAHNRVPGRE